jgi:hypothetical protein
MSLEYKYVYSDKTMDLRNYHIPPQRDLRKFA